MALLEAVVFPQDHHRRLPCCGATTCVLCGYGVGVAGELEGVNKVGVVVQDGEVLVAATPHSRDVVGSVTTSWAGPVQPPTLPSLSARRPVQRAAVRSRRRRRRATGPKEARNVDDAAETQRLNHIVVERNRRRQMNQYLATLRALMPRSYTRRGDQASIVGGAINFVRELEHRLHSLHAEQKRRHNAAAAADHRSEPFASLFTSPQCSVSAAADVEAAVSDRHATVKVLAPRRPGQQLLLRLLLGMQLRGMAALHLNVATMAGQMVFYTITVRMGEGCQLSSAGDVAAAVHDIVAEANTAGERAIYNSTWLPDRELSV